MTNIDSTADFIRSLPIADVVEETRASLARGNVLLLAEPGAGKSTGLPLTLLADASPERKIVMLEPRRLAAIGVAERMAAQLGEPLGGRIGLRMRGQTTVSASTILEVVTEGVLTRMLQADPMLDSIGLVIFDEFHERSLNADLGLALCREVQQELRTDLRLLLMSATLDITELGVSLAPIEQISCAGRMHPVEIVWLGAGRDELHQRVASAITTALADQTGDVLVFLPGIAEIERTARLVEPRLDRQTQLYRLHGQADRDVQRAATAPSSGDVRRVILSTSIAETSLTIDGVQVVIDAGLERRGRVDSSTGSQRLETVMASQAAATQRAGRAGRTAAGVCYRLWSKSDHSRRAMSWQAEILRSELTSLLVETGQWGARDVFSLPWLEPPPEASVSRAAALLNTLGIWDDNRLTEHGKAVAQLPVHPRLAHMLIWARQHGHETGELACKLVALLEDGVSKGATADLDLHFRRPLPKHTDRRRLQLKKQLNELNIVSSAAGGKGRTPSVAVLLAQAYPDWLARRRPGNEARYQLSCGAGAYIASVDPLAQAEWIAVATMGGAQTESRIFLASQLDVDELESWSPALFSQRKHLEWDDRQERVIAEQQKRLGRLLVKSKTTTNLSDDEKAQALLSGIRKRGIACLPWTEECREWQARVLLLRELAEDNRVMLKTEARADWPDVSDEALDASLEEWLLGWLAGKGSLKSLAQLDLFAILQAMLSYPQQQALDALLPVRYTVPSGSKVRLRYAEADVPVLSVKLQEMFGCTENPAVANGLIALKVELLSPARRPVQVTTDLANFWTNSYSAVKKDMAGRYPKHDWPDDPLKATPTAYAKNRRTRPKA